ncbi:MAG: sugar ABC transporter ATP-binding protein [Phycisphaeraceae bacterium]|nr:sugar ABC transporter ATP-binding protein [Phycisphaeraceae bacterium]
MLSIRSLCKSYAVPVLIDVDLDVAAGQVHALVGANGAGKSTLAKILCGITPFDSGQMTLYDKPYRPTGRTDALAAGIDMVHQELMLVDTLTVAENIHLGRIPNTLGFARQHSMNRAASQVLQQIGIGSLNPATLVGELGVGKKQLVAIAAALANRCRVLILDEPTAALTGSETEILFQQIALLKSQGVAIIYISHRMEEIERLADWTTVLRDGRVAASDRAAALPQSAMVAHMAGESRRMEADRPRQPVHAGDALRVRNLSAGDAVSDASFVVKRGEILGLAGLVGSGRTELLRAVFGADRADSGQVHLGEQAPCRYATPRHAVRAGLAMIAEDRKRDGILSTQTVRTNTTLACLPRMATLRSWIKRRSEESEAIRFVDLLHVRCHNIEQPIGELSGGNQQKLLIGRWLMRGAEVFLFDEPTRGIDVAARAEVHRLIYDLAAQGKGVVVVSSDFDELMMICHRIAVVHRGRIVRDFKLDEMSRHRLVEAAVTGSSAT